MTQISVTNQIRQDGWSYFHEIGTGCIFRYFEDPEGGVFIKTDMEKALPLSGHGYVVKIQMHKKVFPAHSASITIVWDR